MNSDSSYMQLYKDRARLKMIFGLLSLNIKKNTFLKDMVRHNVKVLFFQWLQINSVLHKVFT